MQLLRQRPDRSRRNFRPPALVQKENRAIATSTGNLASWLSPSQRRKVVLGKGLESFLPPEAKSLENADLVDC